MLVWDAAGETPNIFTVTGVSKGHVGLYAYDGYDGYGCSVNRILMRDSEQFAFIPNKLSAAMIGAFKAMGGRVVDSAETSYAQWQQYVVCAVQTVARRLRASTAKFQAMAPIRVLRRAKAFFVSQKVDGRNAP